MSRASVALFLVACSAGGAPDADVAKPFGPERTVDLDFGLLSSYEVGVVGHQFVRHVHAQVSVPMDYRDDDNRDLFTWPGRLDSRPALLRVWEFGSKCLRPLAHPPVPVPQGTEGRTDVCVDRTEHGTNTPALFVRRNIVLGEYTISCQIELWPRMSIQWLPGAIAICNSLRLTEHPEVDDLGRIKYTGPGPDVEEDP